MGVHIVVEMVKNIFKQHGVEEEKIEIEIYEGILVDGTNKLEW